MTTHHLIEPPVIGVCLGTVLLMFGRRVFWLLVATSGFVAGLHFAVGLVPEHARILVALIAGVIGAVLAVVLQKIAIALTGFVAGGYFTMQLLPLLQIRMEPAVNWIAIFIGAVLGAVLLVTLFNWALVVLSSIAGATLVTNAFHLQRGAAAGTMLALILLGIAVQSRLFPVSPRAGVG